MKKISIFLLLMAFFAPLAMNGQTRANATVDFETGNISELSNTFGAVITNDATYPWVVTTANNHTTNGTYCIKSSNEGQNSTTSSIEMEVIFDQAGSISFYCWASCESATSNWDYGMFYIDGVQQGSNFLHVTDWVYQTYNVAVGTHVFKWTYRKDSSAAGNDDCFYVDDIYIDGFYIPACPKPTGIAVNNPTAHGATVSWTGTSDSYIVKVAEPVVNASYDFETGSMPSAFTNDANRPWTVVANTHSGAYCAKSANGFTSTNSDLELTVNLATAGSVNFSALVSSESGWDYGRFLIDGAQEFESSGTSNSWADYSYPLTAGSHTLTWRYYKDGSGNNGDDCFYVDDIVIKSEPSSWYEYPNATSPYTIYDATNIDPTTDYMVQVVGVCSGEQSDPSAAVSFTTLESCPTPTGLALATDGATATATWTGTANTYNVEINGTPSPNNPITGTSHTFNVDLSTTYTVRVQANCDGGETSTWSDPVSITTPNCIGGHTIQYSLTDSYNDGWEGSSIAVVDGCGNTIQTLTVASGASPLTGTLTLCGSYYEFVYTQGNYPSEYGWTFTEGGTTLFTGTGNASSGGQVLYTIGTLVPAPTNLTAGTPGTNSVVLNWTAGGSETSWQICINGDESNLITANTNVDYLLSNLDLDTDYTVKVRAINGNSQSCWSNTVSFTTEASSCPRPTNLTVSNLMPTSATLNWEGEAESYNVRYRKAAHTVTLFSEGFENGIPSTWTTIDSDGDGNNWLALSEVSTVYTSYSSTMSDWAHSESNAATSPSYANGVGCFDSDQWLISPQVPLQGTLRFYVASTYEDLDAYEVLLSTTGTATTDFTTTLQAMKNAPYALNDGTDDWEEVTIDLSSYSGQGYIAIHHVSNCMYFLVVDDFEIYEEVEENWTPATAENGATSKDIDGLDPEYEYEWQVMADCGSEDGQSSWSAIATFTTPDACTVPTGLTAEVTGNAAELSWTGVQENYNVQYREVDPNAPATIILNVPEDIWQDGSGYQMLLDADATAYGDVFSATGGWTATDYSDFEYLIPTDAECSADATHFVVENSVSIQIPAGTYDWCIVNPSPDYSTIYIAASNGNVGGRQDNYVFEAGMTYEFTPSIYGSNDGIDVTITDNNVWTLVEDVTNPYTIEDLSAQTTYLVQVQGADCDGNGNNTAWSASATFTTGEFYIKHIDPYTSDGGFYLIASPVGQINPSEVGGMLDNDYDLYYFDQTKDLEWINYKPTATTDPGFNLEPGKGYLYANSGNNGQGIDLVFAQAAYTGSGVVTLALESGAEFEGMNLVGNPFAVEAYIDRDFYRLADGGAEIMTDASTGKIEPMEGVFVYAESANEPMTFTTSASGSKASRLILNLSDGNNLIDRAMVRFGEGNMLPKFQLNESSTKVYMTVEGKDYAVVYSDEMGQMPVGFKAKNNGTYTFDFSSEEVSLSYLHLIDNKNGNDVDLLVTPSYTFEAKTTDYENRFKLVFATGNNENDDTFAFFSNGSFVINNEGEATLQVIDINGRILKSESISGCSSINMNAAQGIYMLRLVNGDNVKVQKVVVK